MTITHFAEFAKLLNGTAPPYPHEFEIIFNVHYLHLHFLDKGELYLTQYGIQAMDYIVPPKFLTDKEWFQQHAIPLEGTSSTYRVSLDPTGEENRDLVVKWNRMGTVIHSSDESEEFLGAKFNSPFEEFSLVMEIRNLKIPRSETVRIQKPLAIFVAPGKNELWRMGREEYLMRAMIDKHEQEVPLDMFRDYVVIYEWIEGIDAADAVREGRINEQTMVDLTIDSAERLKKIGYAVRDRKPHHVIVRPRREGALAKTTMDGILYSIVDYELLERLPEREKEINAKRRLMYHKRQRDRFTIDTPDTNRPHFKRANVLGVDYICAHAELTGGLLWLVGKDDGLVDFFYPERWTRTPKTRLSSSHEIFHTITKDAIHLVWKISKAGMIPNVDPYKKHDRRLLHFGYNSPFEEFSIALYLDRKGIRVVYPRAIYEAGGDTDITESLLDSRRYRSHLEYLSPDGEPVFREGKTYILLWGFYNGSDAQLAEKDGDFLESIDALSAYQKGIVSENEYLTIIRRKKARLKKVGVRDLNHHGSHLLLSITSSGKLLRAGDGNPDVRICNFEFLEKMHESDE